MNQINKAVIATTAGLVLLSATHCDKLKISHSQPNIIFILADDLGYSDLGCYGSKHIQTPNIDKLAEEGIRFTNHYAGTSVSAPSRCALMTGLHTGHSQIRGNMQGKPYGQLPLDSGTVTIASVLHKAGYRTAQIGKWGLGVEGTSGDPLKQGFDYSYGYLCQVLAHNHCPEFLMENGKKVLLQNKVQWTDTSHWTKGLGSYPIEKKEFSQDLFTKKAFEFIEADKNKPFFLYFSVTLPHDNGEAPEGKKYSDIPSYGQYENNNWTESEKGYAAMVTYLDNEIGKLMNKLKSLGIEDNTLVIFTSDNGGDGPGKFYEESNMPYRGHKRDLYEGGIRVPFIAKWKGSITPGTITNHVSTFWDFLPTACELAHTDIPKGIDGISYLPTFIGEEQRKHDFLYFEFHEEHGKQAIIKGDMKCIKLIVKNPKLTKIELYDLKADPKETHNLVSKNPDMLDEFHKLFKTARTENRNFSFN